MADRHALERASRSLLDSAAALRGLDGKGHTLGELMDGKVAELDVRRAVVDVTSTQVPGLLPPHYVPTAPIPALPLFGLAEPLPDVASVLTGSLETLPTAVLDPVEKADLGGTVVLGVSPVTRPVHFAAQGSDLSVAIWNRTEPALKNSYVSLCAIAVWRALESAVLTDLTAGATAGTGTTPADVVTALAAVSAAYAPGNLVIAGSTAFAKMLVAYPLGLGDPDSPTSWGANIVPVAAPAFASKVLVSNRANIHILASPLRSLTANNPTKLGVDIGLYAEAVGLVDVKAGAEVLTLT
jgi:hypothetical protein